MGAFTSQVSVEATPEPQTRSKHIITPSMVPVFGIGRSISPSICEFIIDAANKYDEIFPNELVMECMQYIGFIIHSIILTDDETCSLYQLLMDHHNNRNIESPLTDTNNITYFDLLYREFPVHGRPNNYNMLLKCINKPNILMIFHTNFDHILSIYLHNPLQKRSGFDNRRNVTDRTTIHCHRFKIESTPNDHNTALLLLRSQFNTLCPRIIKINSYDYKDMAFTSLSAKCYEFEPSDIFKFESYHTSQIKIFFMRIEQNKGKSKRTVDGITLYQQLKETEKLDIVGNELCGGPTFDPKPHHGSYFNLKTIEIYQIL